MDRKYKAPFFNSRQVSESGQLEVEDPAYHSLTGEILDLAKDCAEGRVISIMEGGYDLKGLASASRAHVEALVAAR